MTIGDVILSAIFLPLGILCLFRPIFLLYLFAILPVLRFLPATSLTILSFGSINIYVYDYLILIMALLLIYYLLFKRQPGNRLFASPITKVIVLVFIWDIFIGILSFLKGFNLANVLRYLSMDSVMFIAILIPQIEDINIKKERFFKFGIIIGVVFTFFGIWRYFVSYAIEATSSGTARTLLGNDVVIILFPICYILFYSDFFRKHKMLSLGTISLLSIGINFAGHRSGWLALIFVLIMWYFYSEYKMKISWIPSVGIALLLTFILILPTHRIIPGRSMVGDFVVRISDTINLEDENTQERLAKWKYSFEIFKKRPLLGLGRYPVQTLSTDNIFARKLLHQGILGLTVLVILFYVIFKQFKNSSFKNHRYKRFLRVYILAFILFSTFNTSFSDPLSRVFFFFSLGFLNTEIVIGSLSTIKEDRL